MDFSKMRHRVVFLKPTQMKLNSMGENVPVWVPFKPTVNNDLRIDDDNSVYITKDHTGNAILIMKDGSPYAAPVENNLRMFEVWAYVAPKTGREYEEAQKLRAETTYNVLTRYFPAITTDMKILFRGRIFSIESVLNVGERNEQLQIVAVEKDRNGVDA